MPCRMQERDSHRSIKVAEEAIVEPNRHCTQLKETSKAINMINENHRESESVTHHQHQRSNSERKHIALFVLYAKQLNPKQVHSRYDECH
jgi:hypothetical protein